MDTSEARPRARRTPASGEVRCSHTRARSACSMRSARCRSRFRPSCFTSCRTSSSRGLAATGPCRLDVRVMATTNRPSGRDHPRPASFDRIVLSAPGHRDSVCRCSGARRDEIRGLQEFFLRRYAERYGRPSLTLSAELRDAILAYGWPGNVRELENMMKRFVILQDERRMLLADLRRRRLPGPEPGSTSARAAGGGGTSGFRTEGPLRDLARAAALSAERQAIQSALDQVHWNRRKAAQRLGVSYKTLLNKMKECGITRSGGHRIPDAHQAAPGQAVAAPQPSGQGALRSCFGRTSSSPDGRAAILWHFSLAALTWSGSCLCSSRNASRVWSAGARSSARHRRQRGSPGSVGFPRPDRRRKGRREARKPLPVSIHHRSPRARSGLVAVGCAGLPDVLVESELFGHMRDSFPGAYRDKPGLLELSASGSLFLDDAADELSPAMQAVVLRFLESGEVRRVGAARAHAARMELSE